jgi:hypothetical protein
MSTSTAPLTARFGRRSTRGVMLGLSPIRLTAIGLAATILVVCLVAGRGVGFAVGLILAGPLVVAAFVPVAGRPAVEWAPVATHWQARKLLGQTSWRAKPPRPRPAGTLALPGDAAAIRFYVDPDTGVCLLHNPHHQTLAAVLHVTHPAYVLLGPDAQRTRVGAWGRVLAGLAQSGTCASVQVLEATIPDSGRGIADWYAQHGAGRGGWAEEQYEELLTANSTGASTHRTTITLSLDMKAAARVIKVSGGGIAGAVKVLRGDMVALEFGLRSAELHFDGWMREADIAHVVRSAYDPALGGDFVASSPGANLAHAGPLAINEQWGYLRHDSGYSTVLWISEWPRIDAPAHFLHALIFAPGVRKTFSMVARPRGAREAMREIRQQKTEMISDGQQKAKIGQLRDLSDDQEMEDVKARERALISGHADVEFTGWVVVTASSEDDLAGAVKQVERAATQAGCETRPLYGQQSQGFAVGALPLGRTTL